MAAGIFDRTDARGHAPARILVVNPNSDVACTRGIAEALAPYALPGAPRLDIISLPEGPPAIVTWRDWHAVVEPLCRLVEREDAAAYIVACVSDPGIEALRSITPRPVLGPLRCAVAAALAQADRFGIIAMGEPSLPRQRRVLQAMGAEARLLAHHPMNLPLDVLTDPVAPRAALCEVARRMAVQGAEAVILGCAGMAGHRDAVERAAGVPVIEPCQAAAARALLSLLHRGEVMPA